METQQQKKFHFTPVTVHKVVRVHASVHVLNWECCHRFANRKQSVQSTQDSVTAAANCSHSLNQLTERQNNRHRKHRHLHRSNCRRVASVRSTVCHPIQWSQWMTNAWICSTWNRSMRTPICQHRSTQSSVAISNRTQIVRHSSVGVLAYRRTKAIAWKHSKSSSAKITQLHHSNPKNRARQTPTKHSNVQSHQAFAARFRANATNKVFRHQSWAPMIKKIATSTTTLSLSHDQFYVNHSRWTTKSWTPWHDVSICWEE